MKLKVARACNILFDGILSRIRILLYPVFICASLWEYACLLGWAIRNEYIKGRFGVCGKGVRIHGRFEVTSPQNLEVGENVHINRNAFLRAEGGLKIGANTHIARNLVVYTANHNYRGCRLPYDESLLLKKVDIGENVWIGINVTIAPGVTIGEGAIVGLGSVITQDVPPLGIVGTNELRILKYRDSAHYARLRDEGEVAGMSGLALR